MLNNTQLNATVASYDSNAKKVFQPFVKEQVRVLRQLQLVLDNLNFCYSEEDLVSRVFNGNNERNFLKLYGYKEVAESDYLYAEYNSVFKKNYVFDCVPELKKEVFIYFDGTKNIELNYGFDDDTLTFLSFNENRVLFSYTFIDETKILDVLLKDNYLYFLLKKEDETFVCLSHLGLNYFSSNLTFDSLDCFYKIKIGINYDCHFVKVENNKIYVLNKDWLTECFELGKRYYFVSGTDCYFKKDESARELNEIKSGPDTQLEFLFLYDVAELFGLSDYSINNIKKYNSSFIKDKSFFSRRYFSGTYNGLLNYLDFQNQKSYRIDYSDSFIKINDNLSVDEAGSYKLIIKTSNSKLTDSDVVELECSLYKLEDSFIKIKSKKAKIIGDNFYFCNLKIILKNYFSFGFETELNLEIGNDYSALKNDYFAKLDNNYDDEFSSFSLKKHDSFFTPYGFKAKNSFYNSGSSVDNLLMDSNTFKVHYDNIKDNRSILPFSFNPEIKKFSFKKSKDEKSVLKIDRYKFRIDLSGL